MAQTGIYLNYVVYDYMIDIFSGRKKLKLHMEFIKIGLMVSIMFLIVWNSWSAMWAADKPV